MKWWCLEVLCPASLEEMVSSGLYHLFNRGTSSVERGEEALVSVYLEEDPRTTGALPKVQSLLEYLRLNFVEDGPLKLSLREIAEEDWAKSWERFFHPIPVGNRLLVCAPCQKTAISEARKRVVINPSMAFGTGSHPTTRLCLELLERFVKGGELVADIGTGSGILAIAACKLGAGEVHAVDNDPLALRECLKNSRANSVEHKIFPIGGSLLEPMRGKYDLIVANITANTVTSLATEMLSRLQPSGVFIGSGFTKEGGKRVESAFSDNGLELIESREMEGWAALAGGRGK